VTAARVAIGLLAALVGVRAAAADEVPAAKRAVVMLRILAYDHEIARRADGDTIPIAVVYRAGADASEAEANQVAEAIHDLGRELTVAGRSIQVVALPSSGGDVAELLAKNRAKVVWLCTGLERDLDAVIAATRKQKALSFSAGDALVKRGVAIGLARRGDKLAILVDLVAARQEGAALSSALLALVEVVKR
jgi:hypothetical protein